MAKIKSVTIIDNMHWSITNGGTIEASPGKVELSREGMSVHVRFLEASQMSKRLGMHVELGPLAWKYCVFEDEPPAVKK